MENRNADIQNAIRYLEDHLTRELNIREIAGQAFVSVYHFQRLFSALYGLGVGEYIRNRRLTLAGEELLTTHARVIDIAAKYGYESPDSFNRAFRRFHGISPSAARKTGASLRSFAPVSFDKKVEGGKMLEYRIEEKPSFRVMGICRNFHPDTANREIPEFWDEMMAMERRPVRGTYGVCAGTGEQAFAYLIADAYTPGTEVPQGCEVRTIPASVWAVFPCRGPVVETVQRISAQVWSQWLPNSRQYRLAFDLDLEFYGSVTEEPDPDYCEIWLPVERCP